MFNKIWLRSALIVLLGFAAYFCMLSSPFKYWDDQLSIIQSPFVLDAKHLKEIFTQGYFHDHTFYRPLVHTSYLIEKKAYGLNSFFFNLDNLLLHILNAFLVWILIALITANSSWGFWAGLLFVLHPIHAEAVGNISGRAIVLSGSFVLISFICFIAFEQRRKLGFFLLSLFSFALALLCKESSAVLPGVLFLYLCCRKKPVWLLWPFVLIIIFYLSLRHYLGMTEIPPYRNIEEHVLSFTAFLRSLWTDLRLLIVPQGIYFDRSQQVFGSFKERMFLLTVLSWLLSGAFLYAFRGRIKSVLFFFLGWFFLEMLPVSQLILPINVAPGYISSADHFLYLASIPVLAVLVFIASSLRELGQNKKWLSPLTFKILTAIFLANLFFITIEQNVYSSHELKMLQQSLEIQPRNARVRSAIGIMYAYNGHFKEAQPYFAKALEDDPLNPRYQISLAQSVCDQGFYRKCLDMYEQIKNPGSFKDLYEKNKEAARQGALR